MTLLSPGQENDNLLFNPRKRVVSSFLPQQVLKIALASCLTIMMMGTADVNSALPPKPETKQTAQVVKPETSNDFIRAIFGSPVTPHVSAAEAAIKQEFKAPIANVQFVNPPLIEEPITDSKLIAARSRELLWPMRGGQVASRFGWRSGRMHQGTDIAAPMGTPILAAATGKVVFAGWESGYGNLIIVDHGNGTKTKYGHCSKILVKVGDNVPQGSIIGKVGQTGRATCPHLHYEVVRNGIANNPEFFTRRR